MEKKKNDNHSVAGKIINMATSPTVWAAIAVILAISSATVIIFLNKDNSMEIARNGKIAITQTTLKSMEDIGEWEFLSISDEELIDTIRYGFLSDDKLARIYYGTLRLGINTHEAKPGWIKVYGDSAYITLPPIKLLDYNFIDEAQTKPFFESGKWSHQDKAHMYERAYNAMIKRCMNKKNIDTAQKNAADQFRKLMRSLDIDYVEIKFEQ